MRYLPATNITIVVLPGFLKLQIRKFDEFLNVFELHFRADDQEEEEENEAPDDETVNQMIAR